MDKTAHLFRHFVGYSVNYCAGDFEKMNNSKLEKNSNENEVKQNQPTIQILNHDNEEVNALEINYVL